MPATNAVAMPMLEAFMPYPMVVMIRFHRSDDILKYPQPPPEMKLTTAFWRLARGLALADVQVKHVALIVVAHMVEGEWSDLQGHGVRPGGSLRLP